MNSVELTPRWKELEPEMQVRINRIINSIASGDISLVPNTATKG